MIFKTITSSVDETRKTLALFNKDWNTYKRNWQNANGVFGKIGSVFTPANAITKSDIEAIKAYNSQIDSCATSQTAFNRTMLNASPAAQNLVASYNGGKVSAQGIATAQNAAKVSTIGLTIAQTALNAAIGMGIGLLISLVVKGIDKLVHANEEAIEKAEELRRKYEEFKSTNESNVTTLNGLKKEFEELSKGVSQYGDNISLTTEQYERYKEIIQQIVGMSPSLAEGYSTETGYIADKNGLLERAIELQEIEYRNELRKITNLQNLKTSMAGYIAEYKDAFEGGWATEDMSATNALKATDFSNALYKAFNYSERYNDGYSSEDLAREILKSLGIDNIDKEMEKFFNENGCYQPNWFFEEYADEIAKNIDTVTNALSYENVRLDENEFENRILTVKDCAQAYLDMKDSISMANESIQTDLRYIAEYANGYDSLSLEQQKFVNEFLKGFNIGDITSRDWFGNITYDEDKMKSVKRQINDFVEALSQDETTKSALADLYAIPTNDQSISEFIEQFRNALEIIKAYCQENGIEIPIAITDSEQTINDLEAQYQRAVDFAKDKFDGYDPTAFFKKHSVNTQEEIDAWQEIAQEARDATEAEEKYLNQGREQDSSPTLSISDTVTQLNTQLKPAFDSLQSAYKDIFTDDGFTLENVDLSMLDSIKSKLDELNENKELGISIDYSSFDNLVKVLTDTSSESDDVQKAFNSLATSVLNSTGVMDSMDESTVQLVASMLESMGVANANEVAYEAFNAKMEGLALQEQLLAETGKELANVTADDAAAFLKHAGASDIARTYLFQLVAAEQVFNAQGLDVNGKIEKLKELATAYGQSAIAAKIAHMEDQNAKAHTSFTDSDYQMLIDEVNNAVNNVQIDFQGVGGGKKSAGTAGKEAADTYLEAFEKELKDLDDLKSNGKISEKQYLDALRRLYVKYFNQKKKYLKEYEKYEHQYLEGMKSLYESAFSYITKQIDKRIDAVNSQKDAAVSALEAERDARLEAIEAQKEQYEHEIEGIEAQIDAREKEIKAMQDANGERKRAIDLQKAEYELQRMQNQKTSFVYKDGQMVYEADTSGIRDAKQEVEDAKLEIDISKIEKEIDRLEEEKDLLQERIDLLDKEAEQVNQYYDQLIAQTEKHYDAMVKGLEDYKSQFEALTDLLENAQLEASLSELGINMDALLSGSQEEFEKLKTAYIGILADMSRGNDGVLEQLSRLSGISTESISYLNATKGALEELGDVTLEGLEESIGGIGESASTLSTSAGEASAAAGSIQESVRNMSQSIAPLNTELGNLKTLIGELIALLNDITFPEIGEEGYAQKLMDIAQAFGEIASKCGEFKNIDFSSIIGSASAPSTDGAAMPGGEGMEGAAGTGFLGLASAISEAVSSIDEQMGKLKTALDSGNSYFTGQIDVINEKYIPAWENLRTRLAEIIGVEGGDSEDKEGRGKQKAGSTDGGSASDGKPGSIIDIMQTGGDAVDAKLEDPWLKAFNDFATDGDNSIQTICDKIIDLVTKMAEIIQAKCEAAASALHSLAKTAESSLSAAGGSRSGNTVSGNPIFVSPNAKGTVGHAFAEGTGKYKGLAHDEKHALRSEYGQPELTVYPDGTAELTTEPVLGSLPKGTVIFNEEQTKRIMNNKGEELGNTHVEDTVVTKDGRVLLPITPDNELYRIQQKFEAYFKENKGAFIDPAAAMFRATESMDRVIETISNNKTMHQNMITIGDIHLHEVQDAHSLSRELLLRFPNMLLQETKKV